MIWESFCVVFGLCRQERLLGKDMDSLQSGFHYHWNQEGIFLSKPLHRYWDDGVERTLLSVILHYYS